MSSDVRKTFKQSVDRVLWKVLHLPGSLQVCLDRFSGAIISLPVCALQIHELEATITDFNGDQGLLNDRLCAPSGFWSVVLVAKRSVSVQSSTWAIAVCAAACRTSDASVLLM